MIASEKHSISAYRKSTTRFPTSHRWTVYVTPKSPKRWHKNAISLFVPVKFNFSRKNSATKFLCMKTSSGKVVATSFPYPTVHRSIAGDVPIYLKLAFKVTHPFRKRRFPKFLANVNVLRYVCYMLWAVRLSSICLSSVCLSVVCDVGAPYSAGWNFRNFFQHTIAQGL